MQEEKKKMQESRRFCSLVGFHPLKQSRKENRNAKKKIHAAGFRLTQMSKGLAAVGVQGRATAGNNANMFGLH